MNKNFICKQCGFCCEGESTVSLTQQKLDEISNYLGISKDELLSNFCVIKKNRIEMKIINGHCVFFEENQKTCKIHPVKPLHCRIWPLHKSILQDENSFEIIKKTCPGLDNLNYEEICKIIGDK
jgi:Fe-S-cluster containining protein